MCEGICKIGNSSDEWKDWKWGQGAPISEAELVAGDLDLVYHNLSRMNHGASREHLSWIFLTP